MATATDRTPKGAEWAVIVEPRYARQMPWVLVMSSIALVVFAFAVRDDTRRDSLEIIQTQTAPAPAPALSTTTSVEKPMSETAFSTMLGLSAVLLALGAFYTRITKVTIAGNSIEFGQAGAANDARAIADEIGDRIAQQLEATAENGQVPADVAAQIARNGASAATRAQSEAALLRRAASPFTPSAAASTVEPGELRALGTGMPLPGSLLKRLADEALEEQGGGAS